MAIVSRSQDVVMMCQSIEKLFEQKILAMPKEVGVISLQQDKWWKGFFPCAFNNIFLFPYRRLMFKYKKREISPSSRSQQVGCCRWRKPVQYITLHTFSYHQRCHQFATALY